MWGSLEPSETRAIPICVFQGGCPSFLETPLPCMSPSWDSGANPAQAMMILKLLSMAPGEQGDPAWPEVTAPGVGGNNVPQHIPIDPGSLLEGCPLLREGEP